jgi:hypothetical protein
VPHACVRRFEGGFEVAIEIVCTAKYPVSAARRDAQTAMTETTSDPALRLVAKGRQVNPVYAEDGLYIFALPRGTEEVRIVSRTAVARKDQRRLGVRIERLVLRSTDKVQEIPVNGPALTAGWWDIEREGDGLCRWTKGEASLPLPVFNGPALLEIDVSDTIDYVVAKEPEAPMERRRLAA